MRLALPGSHEGPNHPEESTVTTHVRRILDVIEQSYAERITLTSLGKMIDRQSAYLGHLFRKEVGMTVHQWVTQVRLEHAAVLIREGVKIEAISLIVGYRSKRNFYRQFRRKYATTPLEYGRMAQVAENSRGLAES
jgi:transcriptional regulator GlxA family with amidase domain